MCMCGIIMFHDANVSMYVRIHNVCVHCICVLTTRLLDCVQMQSSSVFIQNNATSCDHTHIHMLPEIMTAVK